MATIDTLPSGSAAPVTRICPMSRDVISLTIPDLSAFARSLRNDLAALSDLPGHLEFLGHIARSAGYRNYQHLRALHEPALPIDTKRLDKALRVFDSDGRMARWPSQTRLQGLCLWPFWARLPANTDLSELQVNQLLKSGSSFGDHVLLRRSLIDHALVSRTQDGAIYRRREQAPPPEALALIRALAAAAQRPS